MSCEAKIINIMCLQGLRGKNCVMEQDVKLKTRRSKQVMKSLKHLVIIFHGLRLGMSDLAKNK